MRKIRTAVLASIAALTTAGTAMAANHISHVMKVDLPDGSIARIEYQGDVAPQVRVDPATHFAPARFIDPFDFAPFAMFDRIMADMDRQAEAMTRQVQALETGQPVSGGLDLARFGDMPAGTISYSFVSTSNGKSVCTRSWQVTSQGPRQQPKLVSAISGDCAAQGNTVRPVRRDGAPAAVANHGEAPQNKIRPASTI